MKLPWEKVHKVRGETCSGLVAFAGKQPGLSLANPLVAVLLLAALLVVAGTAIRAQNAAHPAESPLMRQVRQALSLDEHGDRQGAMTLTLQLLAQNPKFAPAIKLEGLLLEESGETTKAAAAYEEALKLAPNDPDLLLKVGIHQLTAGDLVRAIQLLEHCTKLLPGDGEAQYYLAQAYHSNAQDQLALATIRLSLKAEPDNPPVWQKYGELLCATGDCEGGLRWLLKAQHSDASLPLLDYDIALTDYRLTNTLGAVQHAARAVEAQPSNVSAWQLLANAEIKLANWHEARHAFESILALKADDLESLLGLAQCELELKSYPAAVDKLQSLLRLAPKQLLAHFYLSRAYAGMGRMADAQHESALHHLMMEQLTVGRSAETDEHKAPAIRGAHTYEGILALKQGDLKTAENDFKADLASDSNYQMAIAEMGMVRYLQQRWSEAAEQLAKSRTMTPELLYILSDSYFRLGQASDADLIAETLADYGREKPELVTQLNDLLRRNGQTELAQRLSASPDLPARQGLPTGISLTTKLRVRETPGWWPTKGSAAKQQFVGNAACAKCHAAKAASYNNAAMSRAAVSTEDSEIIHKRDSLHFQSGPYHYETEGTAGKTILKVTDGKSSLSVPLLWGFGVSHMGQTYVYEQGGIYYESHLSFFTVPQALDVTPGQSTAAPASLESAAGRQMGTDEAQLCFGCHTTASTTNGKFDATASVPGVTCESCHGPGLSHVAAANSGIADSTESLILNPGRLDRVDSLDFCGACHRTWEDTVTSGNMGIFNVRFAPYRMENSECWKQGDKRITCLACHDPHKPLLHESSSYDPACLQCHSATSPEKPKPTRAPAVCSVATKNCVTCHMPKYELPGMHSSFTDHWIRIVRTGDSYPE